MREIKFRAWDTEEERMLSHMDLYKMDCTNEEPFLALLEKFKNRYVIMQYTGLEDRNGTEIYEGDILYVEQKNTIDTYIPHKEKIVVTYVQRDTSFTFGEGGQPVGLYSFPEELEVVGNIYKNKETL